MSRTTKEKDNAYHRTWYEKNKEVAKERAKEWKKAHPEKIKQYNEQRVKKYHESLEYNRKQQRIKYNKTKEAACERARLKYQIRKLILKDQILQKAYGITLDMFNEMWESRNGRCEVCGAELERKANGHAIDHNHITGKVRGLLCGGCNKALGCVKDNPALLRDLANYLERTNNDTN